ncbi:MAG: ADP-glyceromanno-heptose 6-epimerase [Candidatus Omnitrophica bacterium]|nr:ADP-glyceromanno-heptose 6-epimerase [Candidatus Omnitrophota bacterium]
MIVVTGGAGFIGSVLLARLNALGEKDILVVDQKAEGSAKWKNLEGKTYSAYLDSDPFLSELENNRLKDVRAIFHMGACSDTTEMDFDFLRKNNTDYSRRVAEWAIPRNVYLSYASSAATYGDGALGFSDEDSLTPRLKPLNPYGQSKLDFDIWVLKNGFEKKITGFRFFNVYGPNEYHKGHMRSLVHKGFEQIRDTKKLRLFKSYKKEYPDGGQKRDFLYVKDAVEAMIWFYQNPAVTGIYNLGGGKAQTWNDLANAIFKALGLPPAIEYIDMPANLRNQYQYFTQADLTILRKAGCPTRFQNLGEAVGDYVKNYLTKENPYL